MQIVVAVPVGQVQCTLRNKSLHFALIFKAKGCIDGNKLKKERKCTPRIDKMTENVRHKLKQ